MQASTNITSFLQTKFPTNNFSSLGGKGTWFEKKSYLSVEKGKWAIIELNFVQQFFRKLLGWYTETRLLNTMLNLNVHKDSLPQELIVRMTAIWNKSYAALPCPLQQSSKNNLQTAVKKPEPIPELPKPSIVTKTTQLTQNQPQEPIIPIQPKPIDSEKPAQTLPVDNPEDNHPVQDGMDPRDLEEIAELPKNILHQKIAQLSQLLENPSNLNSDDIEQIVALLNDDNFSKEFSSSNATALKGFIDFIFEPQNDQFTLLVFKNAKEDSLLYKALYNKITDHDDDLLMDREKRPVPTELIKKTFFLLEKLEGMQKYVFLKLLLTRFHSERLCLKEASQVIAETLINIVIAHSQNVAEEIINLEYALYRDYNKNPTFRGKVLVQINDPKILKDLLLNQAYKLSPIHYQILNNGLHLFEEEDQFKCIPYFIAAKKNPDGKKDLYNLYLDVEFILQEIKDFPGLSLSKFIAYVKTQDYRLFPIHNIKAPIVVLEFLEALNSHKTPQEKLSDFNAIIKSLNTDARFGESELAAFGRLLALHMKDDHIPEIFAFFKTLETKNRTMVTEGFLKSIVNGKIIYPTKSHKVLLTYWPLREIFDADQSELTKKVTEYVYNNEMMKIIMESINDVQLTKEQKDQIYVELSANRDITRLPSWPKSIPPRIINRPW